MDDRPDRPRSGAPARRVRRALTQGALLVGFGVGCAAASGGGKRAPAAVEVPAPLESSADPGTNAIDVASTPSTPGSVACGQATCEVGREACCHGPDGPRCVPPNSRECAAAALYACDDAADCAAGSVCCLADWTSESALYACMKPPCSAGEICLPGGTCSPGSECGPEQGNSIHYLCAQQARRVSCGSASCSGETPVCCWDPAAHSATCVAERCPPGPDGVPAGQSYGCTSKQDCDGGEYCCRFVVDRTRCANSCYIAPALCRTAADCPKFQWGNPLIRCVLDPSRPPGTGSCQYVD